MNRKWTKERFLRFHEEQNRSLLRYATRPLGSKNIDPETFEELMERSAVNLPAVNCRARCRVAFAFRERMLKRIDEDAQSRTFFVTIAPGEFTVDAALAHKFDVETLIDWCRQRLHQFNYVAAVEAGLYSTLPVFLKRDGPLISWHVHAVVWDCEETEMIKLVDRINAVAEHLIPGVPPGHVRALAAEEVGNQILYMLKGPWRNYRVWQDTSESTGLNWDTSERNRTMFAACTQRGANLLPRPGLAVITAKALKGLNLVDVTFANGMGIQVRKRALKQARSLVQLDYRRRLQRLQAAIDAVCS